MRNLLILLSALALLGGCSNQQIMGNFVEDASETNQQTIAHDVLGKLNELYPPAKTQFTLQHYTNDVFGQYLIENLRDKGYAVLEFTPEKEKAFSKAKKNGDIQMLFEKEPGTPLSYIYDRVKGSNIFHVTLLFRDSKINRAYILQDGNISPLSSWTNGPK